MYPIILNITGRKCVVIGGGNAALHKAARQRECGGDVVVISPEFRDGFGGFNTITKCYESSDIEGAFLVTAATNDKALNRTIAADAHSMGILVYTVDDAAHSDITLPAVRTAGSITVTASTSGKYPFLAKKIRDEISRDIEFYDSLVPVLEKYRAEILSGEYENKRDLLKTLVSDAIIGKARESIRTFEECIENMLK